MAAQKQDDQLERTFSSYVRIQVVVLKTYLGRWTIGRSGERGSGISMLPAPYDDDDDDTYCYYKNIHFINFVTFNVSTLFFFLFFFFFLLNMGCILHSHASYIPSNTVINLTSPVCLHTNDFKYRKGLNISIWCIDLTQWVLKHRIRVDLGVMAMEGTLDSPNIQN